MAAPDIAVADTAEPAAVAAALGLPAVVAAERAAGFDATVWRAELADGRTVALRLLRPGISADRDVSALALAQQHTDLAPALVARGGYRDRAALALTWCVGTPLGALLADGDPEWLGQLFGAAQRELHRPVRGAVLCHLDYQPFNVLADGRRVTAVVDWTNARHDDPRADLARTAVTLDLAPAIVPGLADVLAPFRAGWRTGYGAIPADEELGPFLAAAAGRQHAEWSTRDSAPAHVRELAAEIAARYT